MVKRLQRNTTCWRTPPLIVMFINSFVLFVANHLKRAGHLKDHLDLHSPKPKYQCNVCGKKITTKSNLNSHMYKHKTIREYTCEYCGKAFKNNSKLKAHVDIHLNERRHKCEFCWQRVQQQRYPVAAQKECASCNKKTKLKLLRPQINYLAALTTTHIWRIREYDILNNSLFIFGNICNLNLWWWGPWSEKVKARLHCASASAVFFDLCRQYLTTPLQWQISGGGGGAPGTCPPLAAKFFSISCSFQGEK